MPLYPFQERVLTHLLNGHSVLLQAPTGAGKTRAALTPFIRAFHRQRPDAFPSQCIYSVPMRVLATQFLQEHRNLAPPASEPAPLRPLDVRIQTGEHPNDPELLGDLVFATLDQTLSSVLGVPYSLSSSRANLNVGAVLGSYLVFDEFHLFPQEATRTTLELLRSLQGLTPFTLMTATFSQTMLEGIGDLLQAQLVLPSEQEIQDIETAWGTKPRKRRRFHAVDHPLHPRPVWDAHQGRSLAICNTVDRAVELYRGLVDLGARPAPLDDPELQPIYAALRHTPDMEAHRRLLDQAVARLLSRLREADAPWILLLHSRFERPHRQVKEALVQALWSRKALESRPRPPSLILVATQVVEVGLDISAGVLHTELAPAAAVLQRAGRCARYPGEQGRVFVYRPPDRADGSPNYAPYGGAKEEIAVCQRSWDGLRERDGAVLHFSQEQELVEMAHGPADKALLQAMAEESGRLWARITDALVWTDASARRELIRQVDSRTVVVADVPDSATPTEESPFQYEGFSLWHGTLRGLVPRLNELREQLELPWALRYPVPIGGEEESRIPLSYRWLDVEEPEDISSGLLFAIHPRLASYGVHEGFQPAAPTDGVYRSPQAAPADQGRVEYGYRAETYPEHIQGMIRVLEGKATGPSLGRDGRLLQRLAWLSRRLETAGSPLQLPPGLLERAVRLAIALHDVGKLDQRWQRWARRYQKAIGHPLPPGLSALVHTDYDPDNPDHKAARRKVRGKPKSHAAEGAVASLGILAASLFLQERRQLAQATAMAIARHHSSQTTTVQPFRLDLSAQQAVARALTAAGEPGWAAWAQELVMEWSEPADLANEGILLEPPPAEDLRWWFIYFIVVRTLRLCDAYSQEANQETNKQGER